MSEKGTRDERDRRDREKLSPLSKGVGGFYGECLYSLIFLASWLLVSWLLVFNAGNFIYKIVEIRCGSYNNSAHSN